MCECLHSSSWQTHLHKIEHTAKISLGHLMMAVLVSKESIDPDCPLEVGARQGRHSTEHHWLPSINGCQTH